MTNAKPQISILGCGWLGLPLAQTLIEKGYPVKGSTTSEDRIATLTEKGIVPYCITAEETGLKGPVGDFLDKSDILIIAIPPGLRRNPQRDFTRVVEGILQATEKYRIPHILYISSTSVFPDREQVFKEKDPFEPDTASGKQLRTAEAMVLKANPGSNTVIRFGGLIGDDRHPVRFLSGRKDLSGGSHRINLIHREDCIGLIHATIQKGYWGHVLHGVAPCALSKKEYYTRIARSMDIPPPEYREQPGDNSGKCISGEQTAKWLDYTFKHPLC